MNFSVIDWPKPTSLRSSGHCFLVRDTWNDFGLRTLFHLIVFDNDGKRFDAGRVKIISRGQTGSTLLPEGFSILEWGYASLGQDQEYYETLKSLPYPLRNEILLGLRDLIYQPEIADLFQNQEAYRTSLLREVTGFMLEKFANVLKDELSFQPYAFAYIFPDGSTGPITFHIKPNANPPTNIHVVIGRNGVGKTRFLSALARLIRGVQEPNIGEVIFNTPSPRDGTPMVTNELLFANLIKVAFSAFDENSAAILGGSPSGIKYQFVGLNRTVESLDRDGFVPQMMRKTLDDLTDEFVDSGMTCYRSSRRDRWVRAMKQLETDPVFAESQIASSFDEHPDTISEYLRRIYEQSSSGHKIVLLTVSRLVELVGERTVVIVDEPEAHLHPPLQAAFIRVLSWLLAERNGVAVVASHSPVMLQEVPRQCVWIMQRTGDNLSCVRPTIETFAENVGTLTREVFRLEVTQSGFHALLRKAVDECPSLEAVFDEFDGQLGAEGRSIARAMWRLK